MPCTAPSSPDSLRPSPHPARRSRNPDYVILAVGLGILGFLWSLHRDMRALSERVSRLEGVLEGLRALPDRVSRLEGLLEGLRDAITGRHREPAD